MTITIKDNKQVSKVKKKGRPKWKPDLKKVAELAANGLTNDQLATALGVSESTFYENQASFTEFADAIKKGRAIGISTISNALFEKAKEGNVVAQIFFLKCKAGWREREAYTFDAIDDKTGCDVQAVLSTFAHTIMKHGPTLKKIGVTMPSDIDTFKES